MVGLGVRVKLPLDYYALFVGVEVLNGVLDGDDMGFPGGVDGVHHAGQGGGFAAPRRAGDQHQAVAFRRKVHDLLWNVEAGRVRQTEGDHPDDKSQRTSLPQGVGPETADAGQGEGEIIVPPLNQ